MGVRHEVIPERRRAPDQREHTRPYDLVVPHCVKKSSGFVGTRLEVFVQPVKGVEGQFRVADIGQEVQEAERILVIPPQFFEVGRCVGAGQTQGGR